MFTKTKAFVAAALLFSTAMTTNAMAGSLENLERERRVALDTILDASLSSSERQMKVQGGKNRLMDMERMVLRDDSLKGRNTPMVRRAFNNYDLTFLVHASAENDLSIADNWLNQVGVSTESLMAATITRRW